MFDGPFTHSHWVSTQLAQVASIRSCGIISTPCAYTHASMYTHKNRALPCSKVYYGTSWSLESSYTWLTGQFVGNMAEIHIAPCGMYRCISYRYHYDYYCCHCPFTPDFWACSLTSHESMPKLLCCACMAMKMSCSSPRPNHFHSSTLCTI